jgi:hypothetical protein
MTYSENRNLNRTPGRSNTAGWVIGIIAAIVIIAGIIYAVSDRSTQTASSPGTTTGAATTTTPSNNSPAPPAPAGR